MMTSPPIVTPYEVLEWVWCPRFIYFWKCLGVSQFEENRFKVQQGRMVHDRRELKPVGSRRNRIGGSVVAIDAMLEAPDLGLKGKVDEIVALDDGHHAPIDFKYTEPRDSTFTTHKIQLCMYALLMEEAMQVTVTRGWLAYVRSANQFHEIVFDERLRSRTQHAVDQTRSILMECRFPEATRNRAKCPDCTYRKICPDGP